MIKDPDFASVLGSVLENEIRSATNFDESQMTLDILEYFAHQPSFDDFCQMMILEIFAEFEPWGSCVGIFHSDGHVKVLGSFGIGEGLLHQYEHSSCLGMPRIGGLFVNGVHVAEHDSEVSGGTANLFEQMNSHGPNALGLIKNSIGLSGFVQVLFMHPVSPLELDQKFEALMRVLRILLPIYRNQTHTKDSFWPQGSLETGQGNQNSPSQDTQGEKEAQLTDRQMEILKQIALGKTNSQIVREIGFSESTVRQETIDIYRKLDVSDRKNAVITAQSQGIISAPEPIGS